MTVFITEELLQQQLASLQADIAAQRLVAAKGDPKLAGMTDKVYDLIGVLGPSYLRWLADQVNMGTTPAIRNFVIAQFAGWMAVNVIGSHGGGNGQWPQTSGAETAMIFGEALRAALDMLSTKPILMQDTQIKGNA